MESFDVQRAQMSQVIEIAAAKAESDWADRVTSDFAAKAAEVRDHLRRGDHDGLLALMAVFGQQPDERSDAWFAEASRLMMEDIRASTNK